jgi:hypothetical protein
MNNDPWLDRLPQMPEKKRRLGCSCSTRAKIILLAIVAVLLVACLVGNRLAEVYRQKQQRRVVVPPPRSTPVIVGTPGTPRTIPNNSRTSGG